MPPVPPLPSLPPTLAPALVGAIPGPASRALAERLARVESRNVTALEPPPIFWERAEGANLWDVDGNRLVDLTAAFGVANVGHAHPDVVRAVREQSGVLLHGMGDVHPARVKVELLERLCALYPGRREARGVLSCSGSDAVETALKTAILATGRAGVLAFEGAYHGLSFGALDCTWRRDFKDPFAARLPGATYHARFGDLEDAIRVADEVERTMRDSSESRTAGSAIGAVLVEPIQGRGGERVPPAGFLSGLRRLCDERGWLLIADETYTGMGRTGAVFACDEEDIVPDLLCVGKGLASGMPLSACLGLASVFEAWPRSCGEALHTQTFLGHPASCAAALASLDVSRQLDLPGRARALGARARSRLARALAGSRAVVEVRGRGLMLGIECARPATALDATTRLLERGYVVLPSGDGGRVVSLTPPLVIEEEALLLACDVVAECILAADAAIDASARAASLVEPSR